MKKTKKLDEIDPRMSSAGAFSALALQIMLNNGILNPNIDPYERLKQSVADEKRYREEYLGEVICK